MDGARWMERTSSPAAAAHARASRERERERESSERLADDSSAEGLFLEVGARPTSNRKRISTLRTHVRRRGRGHAPATPPHAAIKPEGEAVGRFLPAVCVALRAHGYTHG